MGGGGVDGVGEWGGVEEVGRGVDGVGEGGGVLKRWVTKGGRDG